MTYMEYSSLFVVVFGIGTVFIGLVCIIILTYLISFFCRKFAPEGAVEVQKAAAPAGTANADEDQKQMLALIAAVAMHENVSLSDIKDIRIRKKSE